MTFTKLRVTVAVALIIFILISGNIIGFGLFYSKSQNLDVPIKDNLKATIKENNQIPVQVQERIKKTDDESNDDEGDVFSRPPIIKKPDTSNTPVSSFSRPRKQRRRTRAS